MIDFIRTYNKYIKIYFKARMQYRVSFWFGLISNFYCYFIVFVTYWVISKEAGEIAGWKFEELVILYGFSLISYSIAGTLIWYSAYNLESLIVSGELDIMLIRPQGMIKQLIFQKFGDTFLGQIIVTSFFLLFAFSKMKMKLSLFKIIYIILTIIGGVLIQCGSMIMCGSICFWTLRSKDIVDILFYDLREMTNYPLSIYPKSIKYALTYVLPWAYINYYPALFILERSGSKLEIKLGVLSPIIGIMWYLFSMKVFDLGLKKYSGAGS